MRWLSLLVLAGCRSLLGFEEAVVADANGLPRLSFESATSTADEASVNVRIPVTLSAPASARVTVSFAVTGGTATLGSDFGIAESSTLTFEPGIVRQEIELSIVDDGIDDESSEDIEVTLTLAEGAELGGTVQHEITIADHILPRAGLLQPMTESEENLPSKVTIALDRPAEGPCTVTLAVTGGTAVQADHEVTDQVVGFAAGEQTKTVSIGEVDDVLDEDDETVQFELTSATGNLIVGAAASSTHTIKDNDAPPRVSFVQSTTTVDEIGPVHTISVALDQVSGRMVSVPFTRSPFDTADDIEAALAGNAVTFLPGEKTKTITVNLVDDAIDEDPETVAIDLGVPVNATLLAPSSHTVTLDDGDPVPSLSWNDTTVNVTEGNTAFSIPISLNAMSGRAVTFAFAVTGSANQSDFTMGTSSPITIPAGTTTVNVVVNVKEDQNVEPDDTVRLTVTNVTNAIIAGSASATLTIVDDD